MHEITYTIERDEDQFEVDVEYSVAPYNPGNSYGPPEHCEPPSGGEVEDLEVTLDGTPFIITDAERGEIEQRIYDTHEYH